MKNIMKKICICGASLMMITSLGAGINNVSAKKVHRHARTHRMAMSNHTLYKQGERDSDNYANALDVSPKSRPKIYNHIINELIQNHFNESYIKGLDLLKLGKGGSYAGAGHRVPIGILSNAKKVARRRSNTKYIRKSGHKNYRKNKRNNKAKKQTHKKQSKSITNQSALDNRLINEYKHHSHVFSDGLDNGIRENDDGAITFHDPLVAYKLINNKYYKDAWIISVAMSHDDINNMYEDNSQKSFANALRKHKNIKGIVQARRAWNETIIGAKKHKKQLERHEYNPLGIGLSYISVPAMKAEGFTDNLTYKEGIVAIKDDIKLTKGTGQYMD